MKRQKLFAVLAAFALIFTAFGCNSDGGGAMIQAILLSLNM